MPVAEWRRTDTWYSAWAPDWITPYFRHITPDHISQDELVDQMNRALQMPGVSNAWTMPIKNRIDMLTTGIRTPVGVKIFGSDINVIEHLGRQVESLLGSVRGTRSVFAERTSGGYFLDVAWDRGKLARYGLSIEDAQSVVMSAIGGENVTTTIEGWERYPVNVRYLQGYRTDPGALARVPVPAPGGARFRSRSWVK
jgi:copper/silver efflux system protein